MRSKIKPRIMPTGISSKSVSTPMNSTFPVTERRIESSRVFIAPISVRDCEALSRTIVPTPRRNSDEF